MHDNEIELEWQANSLLHQKWTRFSFIASISAALVTHQVIEKWKEWSIATDDVGDEDETLLDEHVEWGIFVEI